MSFIKELVKRRVPHIIGSYLFASSSSILFIAWLIDRYSLPDYYITLALFGLLAILPSVIILAYFHGAPGKDEWNKIEKVGVPFNILFIMIIFVIGHYLDWWSGSNNNEKSIFRNFYFHLSSSENYIENYYIDYGFGKYDKNQFIVESIDEEILKEIRSSVFTKIKSLYANQDLSIDASFSKEEQEILDTWTFHKINYPNLEECIQLKETYELFMDKLKNNNNNISESNLPDYLGRYFVYKVSDISKNEQYLIVERSGEFPSQTLPLLLEMNKDNVPIIPSRWHQDYDDHYDNDKEGIAKIIEKINEDIYDEFYRLIFGAPVIGTIIEIIDNKIHPMVKIKLNRPELSNRNMRLIANRTYHWANGGAEMRIEDLNNVISYTDTANINNLWSHLFPDEPYDSLKAFEKKYEGLMFMKDEIENINNNLKNNLYLDETSSSSEEFAYYLEIIESIDSIAIAIVVDSKYPYYQIRIGDNVRIDK